MSKSQPRYRNKKTRVNVALVKHYQDGWDTDEIAEYLNVDRATVNGYLNSPAAEEVEKVLVDQAATVRIEMAKRYMAKLAQLDELERDLLERRDMVVTSHRLEEVEGVVVPQKGSMLDPEETLKTVRKLPTPVATAYKEVVGIHADLLSVWDRQSEYEEKIEDLLGLEAPKRTESEVSVEEHTTETKIWVMEDAGGYPEQPIHDEEDSEASISSPYPDPLPDEVADE